MKKHKEQIMQAVFFLAACASILAVALICLFLFVNGIPAMKEIGLFKFLLGTRWKPGNNIYGILPMIMGSIYVTAGAIIIGVPIGILTSVFMAEYCPKKIYPFLKSATELLAGIPSVVYGFFGLVVLVPFVRELLQKGNGSSMLTAAVLLGIMILPTIIGVSESALRAVPRSYYEGSLALGATHERSIFMVMLPAVKTGIITIMVISFLNGWNDLVYSMTFNVAETMRPLTANIYKFQSAYGTRWNCIMAYGAILVLPVILMFIFLQKYIVGGLVAGAVKD